MVLDKKRKKERQRYLIKYPRQVSEPYISNRWQTPPYLMQRATLQTLLALPRRDPEVKVQFTSLIV